MKLPIHRLEGSTKPRVFAYREEIDAWIRKKENGQEIPLRHHFSFKSNTVKLIPVFTFLIIVIAVILLQSSKSRTSRVSDFRIDGSKFILLNENRDPIMEYDTGSSDLIHEDEYREYFQNSNGFAGTNIDRLIIIQDLNANNKHETLMATRTYQGSMDDTLFCFSEEGENIWQFKMGKEIRLRDKNFSDRFRIKTIGIEDIDADGDFEIIVIANHVSECPSQTVILDSMGNTLGEYWNCGNIGDYAVYDFSQDGIKEIFLAGVNVESQKPCLAILDFSCFKGISPQINGKNASSIDGTCREKYYILLPRNKIDELNYTNVHLRQLELNEAKQEFLITLSNSTTFELNLQFELTNINFGHRYQSDYLRYRREGKITQTLNQIRQQMLIEGPSFFDGDTWTNIPTLAKYWQEKQAKPTLN